MWQNGITPYCRRNQLIYCTYRLNIINLPHLLFLFITCRYTEHEQPQIIEWADGGWLGSLREVKDKNIIYDHR